MRDPFPLLLHTPRRIFLISLCKPFKDFGAAKMVLFSAFCPHHFGCGNRVWLQATQRSSFFSFHLSFDQTRSAISSKWDEIGDEDKLISESSSFLFYLDGSRNLIRGCCLLFNHKPNTVRSVSGDSHREKVEGSELEELKQQSSILISSVNA